MILSRGRRYLFVHAPKTGGTALALALEARAMAGDVLVGDTPKARARRGRLKGVRTAGRLWKHSAIAEAEGLFARDELGGLMIVTLVRNPWDRMVSYYHWLRAQRFDHPAVATAKAYGFDRFVRDADMLAAIRAWPYGRYVTDGAGVERPALFMRLEALADDLRPFEDHLGFRLQVPVANRSERDRDWRRYYGADSAAAVSQACARDIARFGYRF